MGNSEGLRQYYRYGLYRESTVEGQRVTVGGGA